MSGPRRAGRAVLWGLLLAAIAATGVATLVSRRAGAPELPAIAAVPEFAFVDQAGAALTRADFAGAPWIADLVFTRCVLVCPAMSLRMAELDRKLPAGVRLVSFSVDPEWDTPAVLAAYAATHGASARWRFATGEREALRRFARDGLKLAVADAADPGTGAPVDPGRAILHSDRFVLVDGDGRIRGYFDPFDAADLRRLERAAAGLR